MYYAVIRPGDISLFNGFAHCLYCLDSYPRGGFQGAKGVLRTKIQNV